MVGGFCEGSSVAEFSGWNLLRVDNLVSGGNAGRIEADHFRHLGFRILPRLETSGVASVFVDVKFQAIRSIHWMRRGFKNAESSGACFVGGFHFDLIGVVCG